MTFLYRRIYRNCREWFVTPRSWVVRHEIGVGGWWWEFEHRRHWFDRFVGVGR